ncbi:helix-turn-helix domain-containing protein [Thermobifida alba]|uniref:Helix-turn-helix domain-containing protein n=2 Tax=Thermobifida alba TaxID=53522 RepID=A0ABY4KZE1_THEAE|nr:helix-turn-helix domain-containing protein [Thermobifida alba]
MPRPPKPLRPERSPADWFGAELRYWREHRKLTQRELAQRVWVSTSLVGRIEAAERSCPPDLARHFDEVLETGGVLSRALRLVTAAAGDSDTKSDSGGKTTGSSTGADHSPPGSSRDLWPVSGTIRDIAETTVNDLMKRRNALAAGGALVVGTALTETLENWLVPARPPSAPRRGALGESDLERIEAGVAVLRRWDDRWRLGIGRKAVVAQLSEVAELAGGMQPAAVQPRLFLAMAELSRIVASMSYDEGDHPNAQKYYTLSLRAAHQAGPGYELYGVGVLADMARQMLDLHRPQDALEISRLALDGARARRAPAPMMSMLYTREGWAYARMGRVQAYRRTVAQAEELLDGDTSESLPEWARTIDHAELSGVVGARYRDLAQGQEDPAAKRKNAEEAVHHITRALRLRPAEQRRNQAFDLIGLGRTYLLLGEPVEAARAVRDAVAVAGGLGSGRVRRRLHDWHREAAPFHREPVVAELRAELSRTLLAKSQT